MINPTSIVCRFCNAAVGEKCSSTFRADREFHAIRIFDAVNGPPSETFHSTAELRGSAMFADLLSHHMKVIRR